MTDISKLGFESEPGSRIEKVIRELDALEDHSRRQELRNIRVEVVRHNKDALERLDALIEETR